MPINATVTGVVGPGKSITAAVFSGADTALIDSTGRSLTLHWGDGRPDVVVDIQAATTYTLTLSSGTYTLTIS